MITAESSTIETDLGLDDDQGFGLDDDTATSRSDNPDFAISAEALKAWHCKKLNNGSHGLDPVDASIAPEDRQLDLEVMDLRRQFWALVGKDDPRIN